MQVDGGHLHVEEDCADKQRDERVDRDAAALAADRLAGLALAFGLGRGVRVELKAAGVRAGKIEYFLSDEMGTVLIFIVYRD